MPELPEVETIRQQLEPRLVGTEIVDAGSHWSAKFTSALDAVGSQIIAVRRRGKYLLFDLIAISAPSRAPQEELIVHLGMTGRLALREPTPTQLEHPHLRAWWILNDGARLTFHDIRRFGRIHHVPSGDHRAIPTLATMGPEPWDAAFSAESLAAYVKRSNRCIKTLLLSQRLVAGIGNIYADEAFWLARINPAARTLSTQRAERLVDGIRTALDSGLQYGGTTLRDYVDSEGQSGSNQHELHCYGRAGEPCERCAAIMVRRILDARSTTWCPTCQSH